MLEKELFTCMKMDLVLITYNGWCAIKPNQTKPISNTNNFQTDLFDLNP